MIARRFHDFIYARGGIGIQIFKRMHAFYGKHMNKPRKNLSRSSRIIHRAVMILQGNSKFLADIVKLMFIQFCKDGSGNLHGIDKGEFPINAQSSAVFHNEAHVKIGIVCNECVIADELQKLRKNHVDFGFAD